MKNRISGLLFVATLAAFCGCATPLGTGRRVREVVKSADRAIIEMLYGRTGTQKIFYRSIEYEKPETEQIVRALLSARPDSRVYNCAALYHVKLYDKSKLLVEFGTCGELLSFEGRQYRDESGTLVRLVAVPMDKAEEIEVD